MKQIYQKLFRLQQEFKSTKDTKNEFGGYMFRNVEQMIRQLRPLLDREQLILTFNESMKELAGQVILETTATIIDIESDEEFSTMGSVVVDTAMKGCCKAQASGASATYSRKYALMSLLAISDAKDDPDNGKMMKDNILASINEAKTNRELKEIWDNMSDTQQKQFKSVFTKKKEEINKV